MADTMHVVLDAQTIKHISALSELVRTPNAEYFADAHNAAVCHLRALAAQAKLAGGEPLHGASVQAEAGLGEMAHETRSRRVIELERRIAEMEEQMAAIGAGGVEPLCKRVEAEPQAVQAAVPEAIEQMALDRYKVVPSHESMYYRWAVVADNGTQQLYIGREGECKNMARKFMGAFLDGAFVAMQHAAAPQPPEASQLDDINVADMSQVFVLKGEE